MTIVPDMESQIRCSLGEGPLWHPLTKQLYVTDIPTGIVSVLDKELQHIKTLEWGRPTTAITWQEDNSLIFFHNKGAVSYLSSAGKRGSLLDCLPDEKRGLANDVIADPTGRVLCGTQPVDGRAGRLYCVERDLSTRVLLDDVCEPNGLGFSRDNRILYFSDSGAQTIWRFAYDSRRGRLDNRQVFLKTQGNVQPDGLTVDVEGFVWAALWDGGAIVRIDPSGRIVRKVPIPAMRTTSLTFGGALFETLYVTSARQDAGTPTDTQLDHGGAVFAFHGIGRGRPEFPSALKLPIAR